MHNIISRILEKVKQAACVALLGLLQKRACLDSAGRSVNKKKPHAAVRQ